MSRDRKRTLAAERKRRQRARRREGRLLLTVEIDLFRTSEALVDLGLLDWARCEDTGAIEAAVETLLDQIEVADPRAR